jgi:molybdate transport system substrate-binding protein
MEQMGQSKFSFRFCTITAGLLLVVGALTQPARTDAAETGQPVELVVSAAASLKDALTEIGADYEKKRPQVRLRFNFGSSGTLQQQIEQGAPVDVFAAAADKNLDDLAAKNMIDLKTRRVLAGNVLVLVVPKDSKLKVKHFQDVNSSAVKYVAVGGPTVPAGMRAEEVFTKLGIWSAVQQKAVRGKDVREVLTQVELGNAEAGVVYKTDAAISTKVRVVATAPAAMHQPIRYPVAVISGSKNAALAQDFVRYISGSKAAKVLRRYQFIVPAR